MTLALNALPSLFYVAVSQFQMGRFLFPVDARWMIGGAFK
jgi:hypothetical protein